MSESAAYCQEKAFAKGSILYYSFLFLSKPQRQAITALYAFFREVSDIADECSDANIARAKYAWWHTEIAQLFAGTPHHPATQELQAAIATFPLNEELFQEIIDGMEADLEVNRYPDFKSLQLHCYRVSSTLCTLSSTVFGYTDRKTLKYAHNLGLALRLSNIVRNLGQNARRGRIYVPMDELTTFKVTESEILHGQENERVRNLIEYQITRAQEYYALALDELPKVDRRSQRSGLIMASIHQSLLSEIRSVHCEKVLNQHISLTPLRMFWLAWKTWVFT